MVKLDDIGREAKRLLDDLRADAAIEKLYSASAYITEESSLYEKELVDKYAFCALAIQYNRLPSQITLSERENLDRAFEEIGAKLDNIFNKLFEWFSALESIRGKPRIDRSIPLRHSNSTKPQNRLVEIGVIREKMQKKGLSVDDWNDALNVIEEQFRFVLDWKVWGENGCFVWTTVKSGKYSEYAKLILEYDNQKTMYSEIEYLIEEAIEIENKYEMVQLKIDGYSCKFREKGEEIERAIEKFCLSKTAQNFS